MTTQTALEQILQRIVMEPDPTLRSQLADRYAAELRITLQSISGRAMSTVWSEKDTILEHIGDTNTLVSRLLEVFNEHNEESRVYREGRIAALQAVNAKIDAYMEALPNDERLRLVAQIADHEERITALEQHQDHGE